VPITYYDILQLDKNASQNEIKKSFRKLALKHHPDKNKSSESHQIFMKIVEAYEVLSDLNSRKKYDLTLQINNSYTPNISETWVPPADLSKYYSYDTIKNWTIIGKVESGGIWDIGEKENLGMWKTTLALFACLATLALVIIVLSS
jgi:curved DNA-binding protein CbpA